MVKKVTFLTGIGLLIGSMTATSARAEFRVIEQDRSEPSSIRLVQAGTIPYACNQSIDSSAPLKAWQSSIDCKFGRLSLPQYSQLKKAYGSWSSVKSVVPYSPVKEYRLTDFLPPLIQALVGHRFVSQQQTVEERLPDLVNGEPQATHTARLIANCWGVAYEVYRQSRHHVLQPTQLFAAPPDAMLKTLRDHSTLHHSLDENDFDNGARRNDGVQPGDMLLIYHGSESKEWLDHVAIVIDEDLYFEKAGSGDDVPIRLVDYGTFRQIWIPGVFHYEIRRLKPGERLPDPGPTFGLHSPPVLAKHAIYHDVDAGIADRFTVFVDDNDEGKVSSLVYLWIHELDRLELDTDGLAILPESAYHPEEFHIVW